MKEPKPFWQIWTARSGVAALEILTVSAITLAALAVLACGDDDDDDDDGLDDEELELCCIDMDGNLTVQLVDSIFEEEEDDPLEVCNLQSDTQFSAGRFCSDVVCCDTGGTPEFVDFRQCVEANGAIISDDVCNSQPLDNNDTNNDQNNDNNQPITCVPSSTGFEGDGVAQVTLFVNDNRDGCTLTGGFDPAETVVVDEFDGQFAGSAPGDLTVLSMEGGTFEAQDGFISFTFEANTPISIGLQDAMGNQFTVAFTIVPGDPSEVTNSSVTPIR